MRNVRNFWIIASIDGRESKVVGGPQARTGGFSLNIKIRDNGAAVDDLEINGFAAEDGSLRIEVVPCVKAVLSAGNFIVRSQR